MPSPLQSLTEAREQLIDRIAGHSFLQRCRTHDVTLDELKVYLVQQGLYSSRFTRYLCAMMANLNKGEHVRQVADNLCDELGLSADHHTQHTVSFRQTLEHFGLTLDGARPLPGTSRMIDTMFDNCRNSNAARGLGALCLGAEALVPTLYGDLILGFQGCGVGAEALEFFHKHVACDDGHAAVMWDIMLEIAEDDPEQVAPMVNAGAMMVDARASFFSSITAHVATTHADAA